MGLVFISLVTVDQDNGALVDQVDPYDTPVADDEGNGVASWGVALGGLPNRRGGRWRVPSVAPLRPVPVPRNGPPFETEASTAFVVDDGSRLVRVSW